MTINRERNVWAGLAAGVAGGLVASWVMGQYRAIWNQIASENGWRDQKKNSPQQLEADPTVKTASAISKTMTGKEIPEHRKPAAGVAVHYAFGALVGGAYGVAAEIAPATSRIAGLPFGTAVWLGADELALPLFKLAPGPADAPPSSHALGMTSHLVYGAVADGVRRVVRKLLS